MVLRTSHSDVSKSSSDSNSSNNNRDSLYRERKDNRRVLLPTPHSGDVNKSNSNSSYRASNNSRNRSAVSNNSNNNSNSYSASSSRNRSAVNSNNVGHNKKLAAVLDSRLVHTERSHFGR